MEKDYTKLLLAHCCALIAMIYGATNNEILKRIVADVTKIQDELITPPTEQ